MLKEIGKCSVNQLMVYRTNNLHDGYDLEAELPIAIILFLENPRLKEMSGNERNMLFKEFLKCLRPDIKRIIIDV